MSDKAPDPGEEKLLRERIRHVLSVYPGISPTMLQVGLGPGTRASTWRPILFQMETEEEVYSENISAVNVVGRYHSYQKLYLTDPDPLPKEAPESD